MSFPLGKNANIPTRQNAASWLRPGSCGAGTLSVLRRQALELAGAKNLHPIRRDVDRLHEQWVRERRLEKTENRIQAIRDLLTLQKEMYAWLEDNDYDIALSPASSQLPRISRGLLTLDEGYLRDAAFTGLYNACECPAGTVRGGWAISDRNVRLPVGLHVGAARFREIDVLAALNFFQRVSGGFVPPPSRNFGFYADAYERQVQLHYGAR